MSLKRKGHINVDWLLVTKDLGKRESLGAFRKRKKENSIYVWGKANVSCKAL